MLTDVKQSPVRSIAGLAGLAFLAAALVQCGSVEKSTLKQASFETPEAAVTALVEALRAEALSHLETILGAESEDILDSGDAVADRNGRQRFVGHYDAKHRIERTGDRTAVLHVGEADWPLPIPVVKGDGGWVFDTEAGRQEILNRRIGRNELAVIQVCLALADAQREYARTDWDGDGVLAYARRFRSEPGRKDGLFWKVEAGGTPSPLGPLVANAVAEGYGARAAEGEREPYHGYHYRILERQGPNAPGGAFEYVVREKMIGGFAYVAWPADYGVSGVMTFTVNHDGVVYQKDLGDDTAKLAQEMQAFDPDTTWKKAQD
jgi:hypothetical protein